MKPLQLFDPVSSTYTYIVFDANTREALMIDPVDAHLARDLAVLEQHALQLRWTLETHAHADHITSAAQLAEHTGAKTAAPAGCGIRAASTALRHGDILSVGGERVLALHTPGHAAGSMCYVWRNHVFTGDTLLINGCGRTDFQSGSATALHHSLTQVLFNLPNATTVWPGHDYQGRSCSTIGLEKTSNARVAGKSLAEFVTTMNTLNLPTPSRLDEALRANANSGLPCSAGVLPPVHVQAAQGYAGDISPQLAHRWWCSGEAVLIDVRSDAEREWVGFVPGAVVLAWKQWPGMVLNPNFQAGLRAAVPPGKKAVLLCRSGIRSVAAAQCAAELGIQAFNILEGFEGQTNQHGQRGTQSGWRFAGLPWRQS